TSSKTIQFDKMRVPWEQARFGELRKCSANGQVGLTLPADFWQISTPRSAFLLPGVALRRGGCAPESCRDTRRRRDRPPSWAPHSKCAGIQPWYADRRCSSFDP